MGSRLSAEIKSACVPGTYSGKVSSAPTLSTADLETECLASKHQARAGIYLSSELNIAHSFAARGMAWEKSSLVCTPPRPLTSPWATSCYGKLSACAREKGCFVGFVDRLRHTWLRTLVVWKPAVRVCVCARARGRACLCEHTRICSRFTASSQSKQGTYLTVVARCRVALDPSVKRAKVICAS